MIKNNGTEPDFNEAMAKSPWDSRICQKLLDEYARLKIFYFVMVFTAALWIPLLLLGPLIAALLIRAARRTRAYFMALNLPQRAECTETMRGYAKVILVFSILIVIPAVLAVITALSGPGDTSSTHNIWWLFAFLPFIPYAAILPMSGTSFGEAHDSLKGIQEFLGKNESKIRALEKFEAEHAAEFSLYESQCRELSRLRASNPAAFSGFKSLRHLVAVGRFAEAERELTAIAAAAGAGSQAEDALEKARAFIRTGRENSETIAKYLKLVEEWRFDSGLFRGSFDSTGGKPQETMLWMFLMFVVLTELTVSFMILGVLC